MQKGIILVGAAFYFSWRTWGAVWAAGRKGVHDPYMALPCLRHCMKGSMELRGNVRLLVSLATIILLTISCFIVFSCLDDLHWFQNNQNVKPYANCDVESKYNFLCALKGWRLFHVSYQVIFNLVFLQEYEIILSMWQKKQTLTQAYIGNRHSVPKHYAS